MALEAVVAALSGSGAEHEVVRPLRRGGRWQAHALLRRQRVQPGHWHRSDRQGSGPHWDGNLEDRRGGIRTGVDERDEEEDEQRAEGNGADSGPRGRHGGGGTAAAEDPFSSAAPGK